MSVVRSASLSNASAHGLDLERVRSLFPSLASGDLFFDNPGGTQVPRSVIEAVRHYYEESNANTAGAFRTSRRTDAVIAEGRQAMADLLGARPEEIVFGPNMTTLTLHFSRSLARELVPGDQIVVTRLDHDANISPWLHVAEDRGLEVRFVDFDADDCTLSLERVEEAVGERTRLVAVGYASNAVGTVNRVAEIVEMAHAAGALTFIDAVQYAPHATIDVAALGCDFLAVSAYKFFGPHLGILFGRGEHLARLRPYRVRPASDASPERWESGTLDHEGIAGAVAAVDYLASLGGGEGTRRQRLVDAFHRIHRHESELAGELLEVLGGVPGVRVYGVTDPARLAERLPTVAFTLERRTPLQVAEALGEAGIFVWDGNYYALEVTRSLGLEERGGMVRAGLVHYNTMEEVRRLGEVLRRL